jgi:AcrR family transcriptional regulator
MPRTITTRRASPAKRAATGLGPRPRRGEPADTRARLVAAAAQELEHRGFFGTDTNRIARAAGYAPGTFYKHFEDKQAIFLAVYDEWIAKQWDGVATIAADAKTPAEKAARIGDHVIDHHRAWPGLRASLRALVVLEPEVRKAFRKSRKRQLAIMAELGLPDPLANEMLLLEVERIADAIADGELSELGLSETQARSHLIGKIATALAQRRG